jgi:hypothetical protein
VIQITTARAVGHRRELRKKLKLTIGERRAPVMMMLYRLVRLIETHSQTLAETLLAKVKESEYTSEFQNVSAEELKERVYEIYRHLGEWLLGKTEFDIERRYLEIGARRAHQQVPFSQVAMAIVLTKENLWEFLTKESILDRPVEVFGELELLQMLERFFDRAIFYAALGYEKALASGSLHSGAASNRA